MNGPEGPRPVLVFDGDCGFCRSWVARWRRAIDGFVDVAPSQQVADDFPSIPPGRFTRSVVLVEPDGRVTFGAQAIFRALAHAPARGGWRWAYDHVPGFAAITEWSYRLVADHRDAATRVTGLLWGEHVTPPGERLTAWLFVRLLGIVFLIAFASLAAQVPGLIGHDGILPAREFLAQVSARYGAERYWLLPTLAWLHPGDGLLVGLAVSGAIGAALLVAGAAPGPLLALLCVLYASLANVGGDFLWFQWDGLLLEAGVVASLLAPWRGWSLPSRDPDPPRAAIRIARWLLFRLLFTSAVVKLASGDPSWRHLTALEFHYETQPLPPWTAWYAHHLPAVFQQFSAAAMFAIEGLAPFLLFGPRRLRVAGAAAIAFLQVLILLTGNYGFFNWLALALCVIALDDGCFPFALRRRGMAAVGAGDPRTAGIWRRRVVPVAAFLLFAVSLFPLGRSLHVPDAAMGPLPAAYRALAPLRIVNPYGLFAVMTTERREIVIEGSDDGTHWREYGFRWKPGDVRRRPAFVPGHMPRLDWQMWFAALDDFRRQTWFLRFCRKLLEGSRPVRALLATDPFPDRPPRFLRAIVYRYRFTDAATRRRTGDWWTREPLGLYCPVLTLRDGELAPAELPDAGGP